MTSSAHVPHEHALQFCPGIGPARAAALAEIGLHTVWDLLHAVPTLLPPPPAYSVSGPIAPGISVRVRARILQVRPIFARGRGGMSIVVRAERADGMTMEAKFFNAGYLRRHFIVGEWYDFSGRSDAQKTGVLLHPAFVHVAGGAQAPFENDTALRVRYRSSDGISERAMSQLAQHCLSEFLPLLSDPAEQLSAPDYQAALRQLHKPTSSEAHEQARQLIAARELTAVAWMVQQRRQTMISAPGHAWRWSDAIHARALARLPFSLTAAQQSALTDIRHDMQNAQPMYRLLHGDVGSGKTALAFIALLAVIADGAQGLLIAPTSVLARQHAQFMRRCLDGSAVQITLLTGGMPTSERQSALTALQNGQAQLIIATHAALEESVQFTRLGLIVIDEQHKFGVAQRSALIHRVEQVNGWRPDLLTMTATPIPRTLALTAFGDLALSRIAERPAGHAAVRSEIMPITSLQSCTSAIQQVIADKGQAFIVCPLREQGDNAAVLDVERVYAELHSTYLAARVALVHGGLSESEKSNVMEQFSAGDITLLVTTTVVEVGIDVPGATLLIVLHADRFGLAQLHQLRGRLGRGSRPGRCIFTYDKKNCGDDAITRLQYLEQHHDGLAIAEADLALRGPGQVLGTEQHGLCRFSVAELPRDLDVLHRAHQQVRESIAVGKTMPPLLHRFLPGGAGNVLAGG
jgi:ATP-dependent DNA helicase RecG